MVEGGPHGARLFFEQAADGDCLGELEIKNPPHARKDTKRITTCENSPTHPRLLAPCFPLKFFKRQGLILATGKVAQALPTIQQGAS